METCNKYDKIVTQVTKDDTILDQIVYHPPQYTISEVYNRLNACIPYYLAEKLIDSHCHHHLLQPDHDGFRRHS
jgi:hypothetical protein